MKALLSKTSKMPGRSWGISAWMCQTGEKLSKVEGSTCNKCYARKNMYHFPVVKAAQDRRWQEYQMPEWVDMMVDTIHKDSYFRWFDSGDLQNVQMLRKICMVVERTPNTRHWLPTRENVYVQGYLQMYGSFPDNLTVRISMPMVGQTARVRGYNTSTVGSQQGKHCPAYQQGGKCLDCRACWDSSIPNINYPQH